jgi:hypothetical protein
MANIEETDIPEAPKRRFRPDWILPVLFRPGRTLREIVHEEASTWLAPLLLLTLLVIVSALVAGPLRIQAALNTPLELPPDFEFYSPEMQQQFFEANQPNTSPLFMYVFPMVGGVLSVWVSWFLLGAILHVILTLSGSRGSRAADFSLVGWSMLPYAVRAVVQIVYMLVTRQLISKPGISGFLPVDATGGMAFLASLLSLVDLYLVWQFVLLVIGATYGSGLVRGKVVGAVALSLVVLLVLQALPGFAGAQLSGLTVNRPFFFF